MYFVSLKPHLFILDSEQKWVAILLFSRPLYYFCNMRHLRLILTLLAVFTTLTVNAEKRERSLLAQSEGKALTVKEWKTTPDGKNKWIDHTESYNSLGQLIAEAEYSDFGRHLAWRAEYEYNDKGQLVKEVVYNERDKISKVRKYEYDSNGICTRRLNYNANGTLNSYRQFEYTFE